MNIDTPVLIVIAVAVVVVIAIVAWALTRRRRSARLKKQFGSEYDRVVREAGTTQQAEAALESRERRVARYHIHPLSSEESGRFAERWRRVQARFVDDPSGAVTDADGLIGEVMQAKGYPMTDFEDRAADLSVEHADVVDHYRVAHAIARRQARGEASTEDLRQGMQHYRALFEELIEAAEPRSTRRA
ncbi:MAG: hypothetical protein ACM3NQ_20450 [Bacteroidales bacterium]